jgi:hypothetical protein
MRILWMKIRSELEKINRNSIFYQSTESQLESTGVDWVETEKMQVDSSRLSHFDMSSFKFFWQKITRMSGNRVPYYPKKLLDTRPSTRDFKSRVIWKPYSQQTFPRKNPPEIKNPCLWCLWIFFIIFIIQTKTTCLKAFRDENNILLKKLHEKIRIEFNKNFQLLHHFKQIK